MALKSVLEAMEIGAQLKFSFSFNQKNGALACCGGKRRFMFQELCMREENEEKRNGRPISSHNALEGVGICMQHLYSSMQPPMLIQG